MLYHKLEQEATGEEPARWVVPGPGRARRCCSVWTDASTSFKVFRLYFTVIDTQTQTGVSNMTYGTPSSLWAQWPIPSCWEG